jgi:uncharacterized protein (TIGR00730 family)
LKITVFGGASPKPDTPDYLEAYQLGTMLGKAGHTVLTGGYIGTMEAVSKGANEAGAHVIGVTCEAIEKWRPIKVNRWVHEEIKCQTLQERLFVLIDQCDAAIALPGGVGTMAEIAMLWNHMVIDVIHKKKVILLGEGWKKIFQEFLNYQGKYINASDQTMISYASKIESIPSMLDSNHQ